MSNPYLSYQDCAAYFKPPIHPETVHDWLKAAKVKVFRSRRRGKTGNATVRVRKSVWEKFLEQREQPLSARRK